MHNRWLLSLLYMIAGGMTGSFFLYFHIPGGLLVGSILGAVMLNLMLDQKDAIPLMYRKTVEFLLGLSLGLGMTITIFTELGALVFIALLFIVMTTLACVFLGFLLYRFGKVDWKTAMYCGVPGAAFEMTTAAREQGANAGIVASIQILRIILVVASVPLLFGLLTNGSPSASGQSVSFFDVPLLPGHALAALIALAGALLFYKLRVPAGTIIGALVFVGFVQVVVDAFQPLPALFGMLTQVMVGVVVGSCVDRQTLRHVYSMFCSVVLLVMGMVAVSLLFGLGFWLLAAGIDPVTSVFSFAPGGMVEMVVAAQSLGGDGVFVVAMHLLRIMLIIMFMPLFLRWVTEKLDRADPQPQEQDL